MSERVLDSSDQQRTLVLVISLRVLRDPVLALDASNEALAAQPMGADAATALECLGRVIAAAQRDVRVASVERSRHRTGLDVVQVGPVLRAEAARAPGLPFGPRRRAVRTRRGRAAAQAVNLARCAGVAEEDPTSPVRSRLPLHGSSAVDASADLHSIPRQICGNGGGRRLRGGPGAARSESGEEIGRKNDKLPGQ